MASCTPHALVLPYPAQGHVIPFMELSHCLLDNGFTVTFVNTQFNHRRLMAALSGTESARRARASRLGLVELDDGMADGEDRNDLVRLNDAMRRAVPPQLEALLETEKAAEVTCVIVDVGMSWALDVSKLSGLPSAAVWAASAAVLAVLLSAPKLTRDGVIDADGFPTACSPFQLSNDMPPMDPSYLSWSFVGDREAQRLVYHFLATNAHTATAKADLLLCNSSTEIEPNIFTHFPNINPIGPLRTGHTPGRATGHFWSVDEAACMSFLDAQPPRSVVYVAFGSLTVMSTTQLHELALGLEASHWPFLWVMRPGLADLATADMLPSGFGDRVAGRGKVVEWSPQMAVLAHPSVACFVTHCGWNSTLEAISNGVPLLCWPYFADQFANQTYICDVWRVGLKIVPVDREGSVTRAHVESRLLELLGDEGIKASAQRLKEIATRSMSGGGESFKNFNRFVEVMRG